MGGNVFKSYLWLEHQVSSTIEERESWKQRYNLLCSEKIKKIEKNIDSDLDALNTMREDISRALKYMPAQVACVMRYKYINGWKPEKIAAHISFSRCHVYRLLSIGEQIAARHLPESSNLYINKQND